MAKSVTVTMKVAYCRWQAPNFAVQEVPPRPRQEGFVEAPKTPVAELEPAVLNALAQAWLDDLYEKCGRSAPILREPI